MFRAVTGRVAGRECGGLYEALLQQRNNRRARRDCECVLCTGAQARLLSDRKGAQPPSFKS